MLAATLPLPPTEAHTIATFDARGRVLAHDVRSLIDVPSADNSAMDGYALRATDVAHPGVALPVSQRIAAGCPSPAALPPGSAARIFTGAMLPAGADTIVMQEEARLHDDGTVSFSTAPSAGQWVRRRGEEVTAGSVVLAAGTRLTPQAMGLAASVGAGRLRVMRRPRVALLSSGDELVTPDDTPPERLPPGALYNANRYTLRGLIEALGCECIDRGTVPDQLEATRAALREAAHDSDLIVSSGGVSVGEEDHLRPALQAEGQLDVWQIAVKPGKPLAFGAIHKAGGGATGFIGLPGNPVSSFVTFLLLVRPLLLHLQGVVHLTPQALVLRADFDWLRPGNRREFLRARRNAAGGLDIFANQGSAVLSSAVWGDGLVDVAAGQRIHHGDSVRFLAFSDLL